MPHQVRFVSTTEMKANFQKIINADPLMKNEQAFHDFLLKLGGQETNARHLVLMITLALKSVSGNCPINISQYLEALVTDQATIEEAEQILTNIGIIKKIKEGKR